MKTHIVFALFLCSIVPVSIALAAHAVKPAASRNWAGYVTERSGYSAVSGTWVVPSVDASSTETASAEWVGIGGMQSSDLIQAGTRAKSKNGVVSYEAWYELYPAPAIAVPVAIRAGDTIHTSLEETASGIWNITLTDVTADTSFSTTEAYTSSGSSAEWVVEAPGTSGGSLLALNQFGSVAFLSASAKTNGHAESPAALGAAGLSLVDASGTVLAVPSPLEAESTGFTVVRK